MLRSSTATSQNARQVSRIHLGADTLVNLGRQGQEPRAFCLRWLVVSGRDSVATGASGPSAPNAWSIVISPNRASLSEPVDETRVAVPP